MTDLSQALHDHITTFQQLDTLLPQIEEAAQMLINCLENNGKILWCGNGGSAADCQHLAAELVGRFKRERRGLASIALTTDSSAMTAIANDYAYDQIFARQTEALCQPNDCLIGISTSGNSANIYQALMTAKTIGATTLSLTGAGGGKIKPLVDLALCAPSTDTARIQEAHIFIGHVICDLVEAHFSEPC